jgi:integrase
MINRKNWQLTKKYLDYRFSVDQISKGSLKKEQTHLRYLLPWADDQSFRYAPNIRPTFPEYMLSNRLDGEKGKLSAVYVKKTLATARLFFSWLSDNEIGYKSIKQAWIRTIKVKRLSDTPKTREAVTLEEILAIAAQETRTLFERRARAGAVFLFLSGMRIGAFVSLPIQAVDIPNRKVFQYPNLGVRTKNKKYGITYLLDIPELLKVVQEWDDEIRAILPLNGFWFAPLSPDTGKIDPSIVSIGEHRAILARRNIKEWIESKGLLYHSPHKFRHGHIQYGLANSKDIADYKAVSMNVMHTSMEITDALYSNLNDSEIQKRIQLLGNIKKPDDNNQNVIDLLQELLLLVKNTK